jgi:hypothetical protein
MATLAFASAFVADIVIELTVFATLSVYDVVEAANTGDRVPLLTVSALKSAFVLAEVEAATVMLFEA